MFKTIDVSNRVFALHFHAALSRRLKGLKSFFRSHFIGFNTRAALCSDAE